MKMLRKSEPNYEGPDILKKGYSQRALILTNMDKDELLKPMNSDEVKKYFVLKCTSL